MNICVYGAAKNSIHKNYIASGENLGRQMAKRGHNLIFGGGKDGLMGAVARGCTEIGGIKITTIVPSFFTSNGVGVDGVLFTPVDELIYTENMRERKKLLDEMADAFIVTPGGIGTYDEFFEILTLKNLKRHSKPIVMLNTDGYFDSLLNVIYDGVKKGFISESVKQLIFVSDSVDEVLDYIENKVE